MAGIQKALIIGGGVAGMSCAIQLRKLGLAIDLVDIDPRWRSYGAGLTVTGPTLRALQTVGVLDAVIAQGATWNNAKFHDQSGDFQAAMDLEPLARDLPAVGGVMRPVLHRILSGKTEDAGVRVRLGTTFSAIRDAGERVEVALTDGTVAAYDLVVGADGIFSKVRDHVFPGAPKPVFTGQVIYRLVAERPRGFDCTHFFMGSEVKVGFNPVSPTHMYMYLLHRAAGDPWIEPARQPETLYAAMDGFGGFVPEIRATVRTSNAHSVNYKVLEVLLLPSPWFRGRVVLIGDAAHATTPHLASGAGMAIEDGVVLAEELAGAGDVAASLQRFMQRRYERCRLIIENSVELGRLEMNHAPPQVHSKLMADSMAILRQPI